MTEMASTMSSGERQHALRLYAMHPDDRAWLLSQLPEMARQQLNCLLKELADLGFEPDSLMDSAEELPGLPELGPDDSRHRLDQASPQWLFKQLAKEPAPLTAALLQAHAWRWRSDVETLLASRPFAQLEPGSMQACTRVQEVLIAILVRRMSDDPSAGLMPTDDIRVLSRTKGRRSLWPELSKCFAGWTPWRR